MPSKAAGHQPQPQQQHASPSIGRVYRVARAGGAPRPATVLNSRVAKTSGQLEVYVSFVGEDKRLDAWVLATALLYEAPEGGGTARVLGLNGVVNGTTGGGGDPGPATIAHASAHAAANGHGTHGAAAPPATPASGIDPSCSAAQAPPQAASERSTPEREHEAVTRVRNFEDVRFGEYLVRTWYYSPYPMPLDSTTGASSSHGHGHGAVGSPAPVSSGGVGEGKRGRKRKEPASSTAEDHEKGEHERHRFGPRTTSDVLTVGVGKGGEGARGRLWVCDLCFKYMRTRAGWDMHSSSCSMLQPPGRRVYQRGSYTIWEVDGAQAQLYCQNLSLFGKLFIDHKSVFFHVENFLFYVICDAATSKRDQVMAFFSKEKFSYDDYNLACIVTFPPHQNRGFGKLLIEFSYYLTQHPSTRPSSGSPGTPERPLSDLGLKGYMAYWVAVVLRVCRSLLADGAAPPTIPTTPAVAPKKPPSTEGRSLRTRKPPTSSTPQAPPETVSVNGVALAKRADPAHNGHYSVTTTLADLARVCHLRTDDVQLVLAELGFLRYRRRVPKVASGGVATRGSGVGDGGDEDDDPHNEVGEWQDVEVVITREAVEAQWARWRVRETGVLEEKYVLL